MGLTHVDLQQNLAQYMNIDPTLVRSDTTYPANGPNSVVVEISAPSSNIRTRAEIEKFIHHLFVLHGSGVVFNLTLTGEPAAIDSEPHLYLKDLQAKLVRHLQIDNDEVLLIYDAKLAQMTAKFLPRMSSSCLADAERWLQAELPAYVSFDVRYMGGTLRGATIAPIHPAKAIDWARYTGRTSKVVARRSAEELVAAQHATQLALMGIVPRARPVILHQAKVTAAKPEPIVTPKQITRQVWSMPDPAVGQLVRFLGISEFSHRQGAMGEIIRIGADTLFIRDCDTQADYYNPNGGWMASRWCRTIFPIDGSVKPALDMIVQGSFDGKPFSTCKLDRRDEHEPGKIWWQGTIDPHAQYPKMVRFEEQACWLVHVWPQC